MPDKRTMLLTRTRKVYGLELKDFLARLIEILSVLLEIASKNLEGKITISTTHGSKGQEAHTVIILNATQRQFPKIHPDNLLFEVFGVTHHAVLEEERRLFYVAMTRAEHRLFVLTDKGEESPYLEYINQKSEMIDISSPRGDRNPMRLGELATKIQEDINKLGQFSDESPSIPVSPPNPWELVTEKHLCKS